ncbi:MAG: GNAT family N-acetyltransferase [Acidimicrobiia bacterium]|nr:GNAT family N-acetyltransferase [Acidimicrobiia bacterium]
MNVRRVGPGDEELWVATVARLGEKPAEESALFLADPSTVAVSATDEGEPVGWAWGHRLRRPDGRWMLLLYELDVLPEWQRRGIGKALVDEMKQIAIDTGCTAMWLVTEHDNAPALATYRSSGGTWSETADRVVAWEL